MTGWTSLMVVVLVLGGGQMVMLGVWANTSGERWTRRAADPGTRKAHAGPGHRAISVETKARVVRGSGRFFQKYSAELDPDPCGCAKFIRGRIVGMGANMKVVVTGGAGFIGSELVRQLAEKVDHITVIDNLVNGRTENLDGLSPKKFQLVVEDIRNSARMLELMQGAQTVFHLACDCASGTCARLRQSERAQDGSIILPLFAQMTHAQQDCVVAALRGALRS